VSYSIEDLNGAAAHHSVDNNIAYLVYTTLLALLNWTTNALTDP